MASVTLSIGQAGAGRQFVAGTTTGEKCGRARTLHSVYRTRTRLSDMGEVPDFRMRCCAREITRSTSERTAEQLANVFLRVRLVEKLAEVAQPSADAHVLAFDREHSLTPSALDVVIADPSFT